MGLATWNSTNGRQKRVQLRALGGIGRSDSPHEQDGPGGGGDDFSYKHGALRALFLTAGFRGLFLTVGFSRLYHHHVGARS